MSKAGVRITIAAAIVVAALAGVAVGQTMTAKKAYLLAEVEVTNAQQYGEYAKQTPGLIEKFGGRFIARGGRAATLEGPPAAGRLVVIEFPSFERAQAYYDSAEYQAIRKLRLGAATFRGMLVEGL